jgi:hypothetical protein
MLKGVAQSIELAQGMGVETTLRDQSRRHTRHDRSADSCTAAKRCVLVRRNLLQRFLTPIEVVQQSMPDARR